MSSRRPPFAVAAVVAFAVGVALMIPFEETLTRLAGMIALATFVVLGVAAIAEPRFLAADDREDD